MANQNTQTTQNLQLEIGDEIGQVILATDVDSNDQVIYFPIAQVTERDGERAYQIQYPDGTISRAAIHASSVRFFRITREVAAPQMINFAEREQEFYDAVTRAQEGDLEVYEDFEPNHFVVKNFENGNEYRVRLEVGENGISGSCSCPDARFRRRICKHTSKVLAKRLTAAFFA